jgi:predicted pyridoxine 5'-phosphate oxidase superfamily flavin-nucleotide-binding protein
MASLVRTITFDAQDPYAQALWWSEVLAVSMSPDDHPGDPVALLSTHRGDVLFVQVPDAKTLKNRAHLDLEPSDRRRDDEVARVLGLGAVLVDDQRRSDGTGWFVLADPEGNEFCVLRSAEERAATD